MSSVTESATGRITESATAAAPFGIVIAGHGSRDPDAVREFEALVELVRARAPQQRVDHGYLEFSSPTISEAVQANLAGGARQVAVVPGVLLAARHAKNDMPAELLALARQYPDVDFHFGAPLNLHPKLLQLAQEHIVTAEARSPHTVRRDQTCLVLVGRGTTDPDANGDIAKVARMLEEGMGFGSVQVCYSGTAKPLVSDGLRAAALQGYGRLVVLPFFLFDGVLVKRIYAAADMLQEREPGIEVLKAAYLGVHPYVADVMIERAHEAVEGRAAMNCTLCKYRVQIVGFEQQVGEPQQAHHLQVRGLLERQARAGEAAAPVQVAARAAADASVATVAGSAMAATAIAATVVPPPAAVAQATMSYATVARAASAVRGAAAPVPVAPAVPLTASVAVAADAWDAPALAPYVPHPIEAESFEIIAAGRDWSAFPAEHLTVLQRLVHTSGDFAAVDDVYFSPGAVPAGIRALLRCKRVVTDVTMVQTGLKRALLEQLEIETWCGVHERESHLLAHNQGITRSAAGMRRAWEKFGNDLILAIGDAPTAIAEAARLIREHGWRPQLVIGLPVGFVGTRESKDELRRCLQVPRITNSGTRGGSPWAASVVNALMIDALNQLAGYAP
jgi:precorrin isomerase/sirohydrochlorin ferrochelatase